MGGEGESLREYVIIVQQACLLVLPPHLPLSHLLDCTLSAILMCFIVRGKAVMTIYQLEVTAAKASISCMLCTISAASA